MFQLKQRKCRENNEKYSHRVDDEVLAKWKSKVGDSHNANSRS